MGNPDVPADGEPFEKTDALTEADDLDPREMYSLIDDVMKEDWNDPAMDVYDDYDAFVNLATFHQSLILRTIGYLSSPLMAQAEDCLRAALGLP